MNTWKISPQERRIRRVHLALWAYLATGLTVMAVIGWDSAWMRWLLWAGGALSLLTLYWEDLECNARGESREDLAQLVGLILVIVFWPITLVLATAYRIYARRAHGIR
jgi:hypothetical protein